MTALRIGEVLILIPEQKRFEQLCDSIAARLENAGIRIPPISCGTSSG